MAFEICLESGLRAYYVELGTQVPGVGRREIEIPTVEDAQNKLNTQLRSIKEQGGEFKGFVTVTTGVSKAGVFGGPIPEETTFVVVEKA